MTSGSQHAAGNRIHPILSAMRDDTFGSSDQYLLITLGHHPACYGCHPLQGCSCAVPALACVIAHETVLTFVTQQMVNFLSSSWLSSMVRSCSSFSLVPLARPSSLLFRNMSGLVLSGCRALPPDPSCCTPRRSLLQFMLCCFHRFYACSVKEAVSVLGFSS